MEWRIYWYRGKMCLYLEKIFKVLILNKIPKKKTFF